MTNRLSGPNSLPFHVYDYTPIPLLLEDDDLNTQTATLSISTIAGFFSITLSPRNRSLVWLDGNYGEGIDDNKLVARGSLRAINESLQTLRYRAVYRLNDTMVVKVVGDEWVAEWRVELEYKREEESVVSRRFWWVVLGVGGVVVLCCVILCCRVCCCCGRARVVEPKKEIEMVVVNRSHSQQVEKQSQVQQDERKQSQLEQDTTPKRKTPPPLQPSSIPKEKKPPPLPPSAIPGSRKQPPPVPKSIPPSRRADGISARITTPDNVEPITRASVKPPTDGF